MFLVFCIKCGAEIDENAKFCPKCGASVSAIETQSASIKYEIKYRPSYSLLEVQLPNNGFITAEAGAMVYMSSNVEVKTHTRVERSGLLGTLKVSVLGGETLFINDFFARGGDAKVGFVSAPLGDITRLEINQNKGYIIQRSAYIASTPNVKLDTQWQGFTKGLFGQNLFMIKTLGDGDVFVNTFGAIDKHDLGPGEKLIVDNYHLACPEHDLPVSSAYVRRTQVHIVERRRAHYGSDWTRRNLRSNQEPSRICRLALEIHRSKGSRC